MTKKILMICYYFHPDLEVGAVRSVKFAKFLPEAGWEPIVLTVDPKYYYRVDPSPLPFNCTIYRSKKWPTQAECYQWLKGRIRPVRPESSPAAAAPAGPVIETNFADAGREPFWKRLIRLLFWTPDYQIGWLFPGTWAAIKAARRHDVDIIYNSGPPRTGHFIAMLASYLTGKPLAVDYRDPLVSLQKPETFRRKISIGMEKWIERRVLKRAALVITTTPEYRDMLKQLYYPLLEGRCHSVINGFDADDFPVKPSPKPASDRPIQFLYAGTLYQGRDPRELVVALGELVREGFVGLKDIAVDFYGSVEIDPEPLRKIIEAQGLGEVVQFRALVKRNEYLRLICDADALVLLQSETTPVQIPAKAFEYLATGREILVLSPPGSTTNFLQDFNNVHIAAPSNPAQIKECVKNIVQRLRSGKGSSEAGADSLKRIYKRELAREFAGHLDRTIAKTD